MSQDIHIVCPSCHGINRLPGDKLATGPKCGSCKAPLFAAHPVELTAAVFEKHIRENGIPVAVDFWAPWCGPCRVMAPVFEEAAALLEPRVRLAKVNVEVERGLASAHAIKAIPTLVFFSGGREIARQPGALDLQGLLAWVRAHA